MTAGTVIGIATAIPAQAQPLDGGFESPTVPARTVQTFTGRDDHGKVAFQQVRSSSTGR